jgi:hypothetical protein
MTDMKEEMEGERSLSEDDRRKLEALVDQLEEELARHVAQRATRLVAERLDVMNYGQTNKGAGIIGAPSPGPR